MTYMKPMLTLETFTFKPNFLGASSSVGPGPGPTPGPDPTDGPVIEENDPVQELDDAFKNVFNFK